MQAKLRAMLEGREPGWPGRLLRAGLLPAGALRGVLAVERRLPAALRRRMGLRMLVVLTRLER